MTVWPSPPLSADDRRPAPRDKRSDSGKGATIDDVLGAVDGAGTVGYQECDEFGGFGGQGGPPEPPNSSHSRSEEHPSELQSPHHLLCRPLLRKKMKLSSP